MAFSNENITENVIKIDHKFTRILGYHKKTFPGASREPAGAIFQNSMILG